MIYRKRKEGRLRVTELKDGRLLTKSLPTTFDKVQIHSHRPTKHKNFFWSLFVPETWISVNSLLTRVSVSLRQDTSGAQDVYTKTPTAVRPSRESTSPSMDSSKVGVKEKSRKMKSLFSNFWSLVTILYLVRPSSVWAIWCAVIR